MPTLAVTYKGVYLLFNLTQDDCDGTLKKIKDDTTHCNVLQMTKELELIKSEINKYTLNNQRISQERMLNEIAEKISKSYMETISIWIYNIVKLIEIEHFIMNEQTNYFTFEDNDELTILYRSILYNTETL